MTDSQCLGRLAGEVEVLGEGEVVEPRGEGRGDEAAVRGRLGADVKVILTPPCIFCVANRRWNIQGSVRMTLASGAAVAGW
jgi:hypothetical protein